MIGVLFHVDVIPVIQVSCTLGNVSGVLFRVVRSEKVVVEGFLLGARGMGGVVKGILVGRVKVHSDTRQTKLRLEQWSIQRNSR